jgi:hypothetical protein
MRPDSIVRSKYLIEHYQVIFESGGGWYCVCAEFTQTRECRHTREAAGRHAAQALIATHVRSVRGVLASFANRPGCHANPESAER